MMQLTHKTLQPVHPFPARMAPDAVSEWLERLPSGSRVLDPMCGSGVVLRQSIQLGHEAIGYDVDPLAVLMSRVWTSKGKRTNLRSYAETIVDKANHKRIDHSSLPWMKKCEETRRFVEFWFAEPQRSELSRLAKGILETRDNMPTWATDALSLALSKTIVTKHSGASLAWDVSHSRPHRKRTENDYDTYAGFLRAAESLEVSAQIQISGTARVTNGDCRNMLDVKTSSIDAVITSPPYLNAIDYMRGHKLSLVWLGYDIPTLRMIRSSALGTEKAGPGIASESSLHELPAMQSLSQLPPRQYSIVRKYASDANEMLKEVSRVLKSNGELILVLADSVVRDIEVSSSGLFEQLAKRHSLALLHTGVRDILENRRYLPIKSIDSALAKRMKQEKIQVFKKL